MPTVFIVCLVILLFFPRQMMGVHYRFDSMEGLILGETIAVRILQQVCPGYARRPKQWSWLL